MSLIQSLMENAGGSGTGSGGSIADLMKLLKDYAKSEFIFIFLDFLNNFLKKLIKGIDLENLNAEVRDLIESHVEVSKQVFNSFAK
jgi:hypothetical protein